MPLVDTQNLYNSMGKKVNWSWTSAIIGATSAVVTTAMVLAKPKLPTFRLVSLSALRLKLKKGQDHLKFPRLDLEADLILTVHVTNPNILSVGHSATSLFIYYDGSLLGSAQVPAGFLDRNSCRLIRLPARFDGVMIAQHGKKFIADVAKREMILEAEVDICGWVKSILWGQKFKVHVDSRIVVDPVMLHVIDQANECRLELFVKVKLR